MDRKRDMDQQNKLADEERENLVNGVESSGEEKRHRGRLFDEESPPSQDDDYDSSSSSVQTIDSIQALFIPVVASISLLFMFFFFDSIQTAFVICTSGKICLSHFKLGDG